MQSIAKPSGIAVPCDRSRAMNPFPQRAKPCPPQQPRTRPKPPRIAVPKEGRTSADKMPVTGGAVRGKVYNTRARTAKRPALEELARKVELGE
eukprot:1248164-Amphidinium_carterae.1